MPTIGRPKKNPVGTETSTLSQGVKLESIPKESAENKLDKLIDITSDLVKKVDENASEITKIKTGGEPDFKAKQTPQDVIELDAKLPDWLKKLKNDILGLDVKLILQDPECHGGSTLVIPRRLSLLDEPIMDVVMVNGKPEMKILKDKNEETIYKEDKRSIATFNVFNTTQVQWEDWFRKVKKTILKAYEAKQMPAPDFNTIE